MADQAVTKLKRMLARLDAGQIEHRGVVKAKTLDGDACDIRGPYFPTPESEGRARKIVALRKQIARMED